MVVNQTCLQKAKVLMGVALEQAMAAKLPPPPKQVEAEQSGLATSLTGQSTNNLHRWPIPAHAEGTVATATGTCSRLFSVQPKLVFPHWYRRQLSTLRPASGKRLKQEFLPHAMFSDLAAMDQFEALFQSSVAKVCWEQVQQSGGPQFVVHPIYAEPAFKHYVVPIFCMAATWTSRRERQHDCVVFGFFVLSTMLPDIISSVGSFFSQMHPRGF